MNSFLNNLCFACETEKCCGNVCGIEILRNFAALSKSQNVYSKNLGFSVNKFSLKLRNNLILSFMKKLIFSLLALCVGMCAMAQSSVYVYKKSGATLELEIAELDSISFTKPAVTPTPETLTGVFSVSADKTVKFAHGNLQCTLSANDTVWAFAENQYDMIGTDNVEGSNIKTDADYGDTKNGTALASKIDLFGWSADNETAPWGISTSTTKSDYSGDFVDWGKKIDGGKTWRTLTKDEWEYLLETRDNASTLCGAARINLNDDGTKYVNGVILLPDSWTLPDGISFTSGFPGVWSETGYATQKTYTLANWRKLEAAGAVFLPAAGYRKGLEVTLVRFALYYWYATPQDDENAYYLMVNPNGTNASSLTARFICQSVRLVQDVE